SAKVEPRILSSLGANPMTKDTAARAARLEEISMTAPCPPAESRRPLGAFVAALATAHGKTLAIFLVLAAIWWALPEGSSARALYSLLCGVLAVLATFFATALWLVKKCPAHTSAVSPDDGFVVRARRRVGNRLARLRKASDATLRKWHNEAGACSAPL